MRRPSENHVVKYDGNGKEFWKCIRDEASRIRSGGKLKFRGEDGSWASWHIIPRRNLAVPF